MANTFVNIASVTVGSGGVSSIDFTSIPATYTDLVVKASLRNNASVSIRNAYLRVNGDSSNIYYGKIIDGIGSGIASASSGPDPILYWSGLTNDTTSTTNTFSNYEFYIPNYASGSSKLINVDAAAENNATFGQQRFSALLAATSSPITSINIIGEADFIQYSTAYLYGIKNA